MKEFLAQYQEYLSFFESKLKDFCDKMSYRPSILADSMRYSLLSGGKRVRPVLFLSALDSFEVNYQEEIEFALALECIHTYSLIHDDLPAMDNDDMRRGKPSCHKAFGEANAILAGDGLLSLALELLLKVSGKSEAHLRAAQILSKAMGVEGMVAGQSADLFYTGKQAGQDELFYIYHNKTAALISAPLVMAAILAKKDVSLVKEFGDCLGILFQMTDDILDAKGESQKMGKTLGKDEAEDKFTCVKVFGLSKAEDLADEYEKRAIKALNGVGNFGFLRQIVNFVRGRDY